MGYIKTRIKHNKNLTNLLQPTQLFNNKHLPLKKIAGISTQLDFIHRFIISIWCICKFLSIDSL